MSNHTMLIRLGITPNYAGFSQALFAAQLASQDPDCLQLVTKRLYPAIAKEFGTTWKAVERNIRTAISIAWSCNPELLEELAGRPLTCKPKTAQFISILSCIHSEQES